MLESMGLMFLGEKSCSGTTLMSRSSRRVRLGPKDILLTMCDRLAMGGLMLWCLDRIWMWKFPGTLNEKTESIICYVR